MGLETSVLEDLLDKYEKSKHLKEPNTSNRRVTLSKEKGELKGYDWENLNSLERFRKEALFLEGEHLLTVDWEVKDKVISQVILNLAQVENSYKLLNRTPPWVLRQEGMDFLTKELEGITTPWILQWKDFHLEQLEKTWKLPFFLKKDENFALGLCALLRHYDRFPETGMTLRSFSVQVFQNSKTLEQVYLEEFLKLCRGFHPELMKICEVEVLSPKDQLLFLGITPRWELLELSGKIEITTALGCLDVGAMGNWGLALSGFSCQIIKKIDFTHINQVYFVENKTNYETMILNPPKDSLIIYHGGFFSPAKGQFFQAIQNSLPCSGNIQVFFWGDIDLGGFMMFQRLQAVIPTLQPYQMQAQQVIQYANYGLTRDKSYLNKVKLAFEQGKFPLFQEVLRKILEYQVTIEQEVFLHDWSEGLK